MFVPSPGSVARDLDAYDLVPRSDVRRGPPRAFASTLEGPVELALFIADPEAAKRGDAPSHQRLPLAPPGGHRAAQLAAMAAPRPTPRR